MANKSTGISNRSSGSGIRIIKRLYRYLRPFNSYYLTGTFIIIASEVLIQVMCAFMLKGLTDAALDQNLPMLLRAITLSSITALFLASTLPIGIRLKSVAVERSTTAMRLALFQHLQSLPIAYHEEHHSGDTISRLTNDVTAAKDGIGNALYQMLSSVLVALLCGLVMLWINWQLTIVAALFAILPLVINHLTAGPLRTAGTKVQESMSNLNSRLLEIITAMPVVRIFGLTAHFNGQYHQANGATRQAGRQRAHWHAISNAANNIFGNMNFIGLLSAGALLLVRGQITPGELLAVSNMAHTLGRPFVIFGDQWAALQSAIASSERIIKVLDQQPEKKRHNSTNTLSSYHRELGIAIDFQDLAFSYGGKSALEGVSFSVPSGSVIGLVGSSGSGKSTLLKLLLGFYQAQRGTIIINGISIDHYPLEQLRDMLAFVPQDAYIYTGTIYDNIAYAKSGATREEVIAAAKAANAHEFITQLPDGYTTQVGERGTQLSGGQRQRVAIARALLKDAPILLLDEATSSLDTESERLVQEALERLMAGRTTLVIAHRLSTIQQADCIHVMADGKVVESGNHNQLLERNGLYARLYNIQLGKSA